MYSFKNCLLINKNVRIKMHVRNFKIRIMEGYPGRFVVENVLGFHTGTTSIKTQRFEDHQVCRDFAWNMTRVETLE